MKPDRDGRPVATAPANGAIADPAFMAVAATLATTKSAASER